jgi:hypothetical protein
MRHETRKRRERCRKENEREEAHKLVSHQKPSTNGATRKETNKKINK